MMKTMSELENQIICGDSASVLEEIPANSIDLTVTSPPYDNIRDYNGFQFNFEKVAHELYRVTKDGGIVVWIVNDGTEDGSETGTSFRHALYFKDAVGFLLHDTMIYWKSGIQKPSSNRCHQVFEFMFVFSKGKPKTFNLLKDRENTYRRSGRGTYRQKNGTITKSKESAVYGEMGGRFNIWYYKVGKGHSSTDKFAYEHPAIFPEELAHDHIKCWSNPHEMILDPFCGSGTTLKMAKILQRRYIGIDISSEYVKMSKKRVSIQPIL